MDKEEAKRQERNEDKWRIKKEEERSVKRMSGRAKKNNEITKAFANDSAFFLSVCND